MTAATKNTGDILGPLKSVPAETVYTAEQQAARAMLAALKDIVGAGASGDPVKRASLYLRATAAIAQAEATGIKVEG